MEREKMKKKTIKTACLTAAALVLSAGLTVGSAMAYFTTYTVSDGGVKLHLGAVKTEIGEQVNIPEKRKELQLTNTGEFDCYVRLKAVTGDAYKDGIVYSEPDDKGNWTPGVSSEGYYYYNDILEPGETTTRLDVNFRFPAGEEPADFNVIIIQECTPVLYDKDGNPYADWDVKADVTQESL